MSSPSKIRDLVDAQRVDSGNDRRSVETEIRTVKKSWTFRKGELREKIRNLRTALLRAQEEMRIGKEEYEAKILELQQKRDALPEYRRADLPDEIKIAAYQAHVAGYSTSKIRVALGFSSFAKARDLIEEGKSLTKGGW